jgi:hypothetical protein
MNAVLSTSEESLKESKVQTRMADQPKKSKAEAHKPSWLTFFDEEESEFIEKI